MSKRRKKEEEHVNHERWLVSYADFITLLFAFFVVMYAVSSINEGKYRVLSESLMAAFHTQTRSLRPIQVGDPTQGAIKGKGAMGVQPVAPPLPYSGFAEQMKSFGHARAMGSVRPVSHRTRPKTDPAAQSKQQLHMKLVADQIQKALQGLVDKKLVVVHRNPLWIEVQINSSVLFESGSTKLSSGARNVIAKVSKVLASLPNRIHVEGFTDNVPISTPQFPSNWELSAGRAASVVHLMTGYGIDPSRLAATGYGQYHPIADNSTPQGRARNRRVVLVILAAADGDKGDTGTAPPPTPQVVP